jgi:hypothetical protein
MEREETAWAVVEPAAMDQVALEQEELVVEALELEEQVAVAPEPVATVGEAAPAARVEDHK